MPTYCSNGCGMIDVYPEDENVYSYDHCIAASAAPHGRSIKLGSDLASEKDGGESTVTYHMMGQSKQDYLVGARASHSRYDAQSQ